MSAINKKYRELKGSMPINAPKRMPLPKGPQIVPPIQREIRKRILPRGRIV